jgi:hypothetical protein
VTPEARLVRVLPRAGPARVLEVIAGVAGGIALDVDVTKPPPRT